MTAVLSERRAEKSTTTIVAETATIRSQIGALRQRRLALTLL
jgi:hypothetical protein